jgi:hypothetical protein
VAYVQLPQIDDRKSEKLAVLLSAENMGGLLLCAGPAYLLTTGWDFLPRIVLLVVAALLGVALTVRVGGMALYARLLWQLRGVVWLYLKGEDVLPEHLAGAARREQRGVVLPVRGVARLTRRTRPVSASQVASAPLRGRRQ